MFFTTILLFIHVIFHYGSPILHKGCHQQSKNELSKVGMLGKLGRWGWDIKWIEFVGNIGGNMLDFSLIKYGVGVPSNQFWE